MKIHFPGKISETNKILTPRLPNYVTKFASFGYHKIMFLIFFFCRIFENFDSLKTSKILFSNFFFGNFKIFVSKNEICILFIIYSKFIRKQTNNIFFPKNLFLLEEFRKFRFIENVKNGMIFLEILKYLCQQICILFVIFDTKKVIFFFRNTKFIDEFSKILIHQKRQKCYDFFLEILKYLVSCRLGLVFYIHICITYLSE